MPGTATDFAMAVLVENWMGAWHHCTGGRPDCKLLAWLLLGPYLRGELHDSAIADPITELAHSGDLIGVAIP
jgi:hypothetical protein